MCDQPFADLGAETSEDVDDAGRKACLLEQRPNSSAEADENSEGFQTIGVAGGERGRQLPCGEHERRVPRRDRGNDAERLFAREIDHPGFVDRDDATFDLVREPAEVMEPLRDVAQLRPHFGDQLAVVLRLDRRKPVGIGSDKVREAAQQVAARRCGEPAPVRVAKRLVSGRNGAINVVRVGARHERPGDAEVGVFSLEGLTRSGGSHAPPISIS